MSDPASAAAMADETPDGAEEPPRSTLGQMSPARRAAFWGFAGLVLLAIAFYLWWGLSFGVWLDNGVYAVFITLFLFGLAGMWLMLPNPPVPAAPKA
jgi:hypothetical protein